MVVFLKIVAIIVLLLLLMLPLFFTSRKRIFSYKFPDNKRNLVFIFVAIAELIVLWLLSSVFDSLVDFIMGIPIIGRLISSALASKGDFIVFVIMALIINVIMIYGFYFIKLIVLSLFRKRSKKQEEKEKKEKEENGKEEEEDKEKEEEKKNKKKKRVPSFVHSLIQEGLEETKSEEDQEENYGQRWFTGLFFEEEEDYKYAKPWVIKLEGILQNFILLVGLLYLLLFLALLIILFFPVKDWLYDFFVDVLNVQKWYIYPFVSLLLLQEVCNTLHTAVNNKVPQNDEEKKEELTEEEEDNELEIKLRKLQNELKKRYDKEHTLRYYPASIQTKEEVYTCTTKEYKSAFDYIEAQMRVTSNRVVYSYMESIDSMFNGNNIYFCASFYSEFGEYLITYTYTRLLSGARMIFVISEEDKRIQLRDYISKRLRVLTGTTERTNWRVYTSDERVDQADILIATPKDFADDNIVDQYPGFFEEVCNAVFIDADKIVSLDSYLCPVMAIRIQRATQYRAKFVFLTRDIYRGFATGSLPKFFCVDKVLSYSSAKENEAVSYTLWNKESKSNRIYNKYGQTLTSVDCLIAELAYEYEIDGIRLITSNQIDHAEMLKLTTHDVEVNGFYKRMPNINFLIYADDKFNLSSALYMCMRFRGKDKSIVHILSKPYLLREFFANKMISEDFINRSSFIQPRVTEHADKQKLSLLRIFCDATDNKGITLDEFRERMNTVLEMAEGRGDRALSPFCRQFLKSGDRTNVVALAKYLIAGLCDSETTPIKDSYGNFAKDYFLIVEDDRDDKYSLTTEKIIFFKRVKEIFDNVFSCNERVKLYLHDRQIGYIDTFPSRLNLEYTIGQSILYKNTEYEIEQISQDCRAIFLRSENVTFKNTLDTIFLRRYENIKLDKRIGIPGVLNLSTTNLEEIIVEKYKAAFEGETYGFYSIMSDCQTIDFIKGVKGNPHIEREYVESTKRRVTDGRLLKVTLKARIAVSDGMRNLLSVVLNEFIKTIFPMAYRCIAICPILQNPIEFDEENEPVEINDKINTLYPYIKHAGLDYRETDENRIQLLFINDCLEDVGVLDWFYDRFAHYMQEFLANAYSYMHWLSLCPNLKHYIYFGADNLAECFDLQGCCDLLDGFNFLLSDNGEKDIETAGELPEDENLGRCAFCHRIMESGRYSYFDDHRFICADCYDVVSDDDRLSEICAKMYKYLTDTYPGNHFAKVAGKLEKFDIEEGKVLSENYYYLSHDFHEDVKSDKVVVCEMDDPSLNVEVSILRGIIEYWQRDNEYLNSYYRAQLYYEEIEYLKSVGFEDSAEWIFTQLDDQTQRDIEEIRAFIAGGVDNLDTDTDTDLESSDETKVVKSSRTSFMFMIEESKKLIDDYDDGTTDLEDDYDGLYDPNKTPKILKRYLRNLVLDDGQDEKGEGLDDDGDIEDLTDDSEIEDLTDDDSSEDEDISEEEDVEANERVFDMSEFRADAPPPSIEEESEEDIDLEKEDADEEESSEDLDEDPMNEDLGGDTDEVSDDEPELSEKEKKKKAKLEEKQKKKEEKEKKKQEKKEAKEKKKQERLNKKNKKKGSNDSEDNGDLDTELPKNEDLDEDNGDNGDNTDNEDLEKGKKGKKKDKDDKKVSKEDKKKLKDEEQKKKKEEKDLKKKHKKPEFTKVPYDKDEETNPKIRLYNEMARAIYKYSTEHIDRRGISDDELKVIYYYVISDYPEFFWVDTFVSTDSEVWLKYRCTLDDGSVDVKQIVQKRKDLEKAAKPFIAGITKKTDPHEAVLTIYKRLILNLDYDTEGLNLNVDDVTKDDGLRSLYSALVTHKVVCAGYAKALQYLLQLVGIPTAYIISEINKSGGCHAFNILKIGKYCYYIDATWGDYSSTVDTDSSKKNKVFFDYACVPFREFILTTEEMVPDHIPRKAFYPALEKFNSVRHEYFRSRGCYIEKSFDEKTLLDIFTNCAKLYNPKEDGEFSISMRCFDERMRDEVVKYLQTNGAFYRIAQKAAEILDKSDKKASQLLKNIESYYWYANKCVNTLYIFVEYKGKK